MGTRGSSLRREGWEVGKHHFYRVYCEKGLALHRERPWRYVTVVGADEIWSMDCGSHDLL